RHRGHAVSALPPLFLFRCVSWSRFLAFFFFFSSRRRHTRFSRDWSSDVCSSDLACHRPRGGGCGWRPRRRGLPPRKDPPRPRNRSEERRVGKECRSRGAPEHGKKKEKARRERGA